MTKKGNDIMTNQELLAELATVQPTAAKRFEPRKISDMVVAYFAKAMAERGYVHTEATLSALRATLEGYNVCLVGDPGVGKTAFFEALSSVTYPAFYVKIHPESSTETPWRMARINMREVAWFSQADVERFLDRFSDTPLLIDDVGAEPLTVYGHNNAIFDMILEQRLNGSSQTFMTRSLRGKDFVARYGDSTTSRIKLFKTFDLGTYALGSHSLRQSDRLRFESRMWNLGHKSPCRPDAREMTECHWCNMLPWPTNFISR